MDSWHQIQSEVISGFGYDPARRILRVAFRSGSIYDYEPASPTLVKNLLHAPSKGAYFAANIRNSLNFTRVK